MQVLILEDDPGFQAQLAQAMIAKGFHVLGVDTIPAAEAFLRLDMADVLLFGERIGGRLAHSVALLAECRNPLVAAVLLSDRTGPALDELFDLMPSLVGILGRPASPAMVTQVVMAAVANMASDTVRGRLAARWAAAEREEDDAGPALPAARIRRTAFAAASQDGPDDIWPDDAGSPSPPAVIDVTLTAPFLPSPSPTGSLLPVPSPSPAEVLCPVPSPSPAEVMLPALSRAPADVFVHAQSPAVPGARLPAPAPTGTHAQLPAPSLHAPVSAKAFLPAVISSETPHPVLSPRTLIVAVSPESVPAIDAPAPAEAVPFAPVSSAPSHSALASRSSFSTVMPHSASSIPSLVSTEAFFPAPAPAEVFHPDTTPQSPGSTVTPHPTPALQAPLSGKSQETPRSPLTVPSPQLARQTKPSPDSPLARLLARGNRPLAQGPTAATGVSLSALSPRRHPTPAEPAVLPAWLSDSAAGAAASALPVPPPFPQPPAPVPRRLHLA